MAADARVDITVSSLYETLLDPARWELAIAAMSDLFEAPNVAMFDYDFASQSASNFRLRGHDPEVARVYAAYYHHLDPGRPKAAAAGVGEWPADESMLDVRAPQHQEYVQDFALRSNIGHVAGCKVTGDDQSCQYLSLTRPPGAERFGAAARNLYLALQPHLQRIVRMQRKIETLAAGNALAHAALDRLRAAVVVVDKSRRVQLVNAHGFQLLSSGKPIAISQRRLVCRSPLLDELLGRVIRGACTTPPCGGGLRVPRGHGVADLLLMIVPIPQDHELSRTTAKPLALVVLGDPDLEHAPPEVYRSIFSLTAAEAALLSALGRGVSVAEWTRQRGVSVATVRTQLHALFEKTGVDSQARLVRLAKSVPPIG